MPQRLDLEGIARTLESVALRRTAHLDVVAIQDPVIDDVLVAQPRVRAASRFGQHYVAGTLDVVADDSGLHSAASSRANLPRVSSTHSLGMPCRSHRPRVSK